MKYDQSLILKESAVSSYACRVVRIEQPVENHPNADRLSIVRIDGYTCVSAKLADGSHRYKPGDLVVYIPVGGILPEWLLRDMGLWDEAGGKGRCAGAAGDRLSAVTLRGVRSRGLLYPVEKETDESGCLTIPIWTGSEWSGSSKFTVAVGEDVIGRFGIRKYVPEVPENMIGVAKPLFGYTVTYDFDDIEKHPTLFEAGETVVATEKIHGVNAQIGFIPDLNDPELWPAKGGGSIFVTSKGLGEQGIVFKNVPENAENIYVQCLNSLLAAGLAERLPKYARLIPEGRAHLFGEIFGPKIQELHYGRTEQDFRLFDIRIQSGSREGTYLPYDGFQLATYALQIEKVPILYLGPYDPESIKRVRDGKDSLSNTNVREGVVVKSAEERQHPVLGRKIAKWISPGYDTTRGADATEYR
jgi:RNA ligase (TIGR02306 family)